MNTISVKEAAARWSLTERSVSGFCQKGKIAGAKKQGKTWLIPADASKPQDCRRKAGTSVQIKSGIDRLPLPVGVSDYRLASTEYYYVDKTLMIRDFIDERPMVTLFTRPRRFGKTLNMDMIRTFFEKTEEDTSVYFIHKKIWACGEKYRACQGKYPVISVSFKDVKYATWRETYLALARVIGDEFARHASLQTSSVLSEKEKESFALVLNGRTEENDLAMSLQLLSALLHKDAGMPAVVIVDEYDTPIQSGYSNGFYNEVISFMRNLFSACLKDNKHLAFGFLTGILRVAKESIFSGLNNLAINSVMDHKYSAYFGFTTDEVREMAAYYGAEEHFAELCEWYDGYRFGKTDIFNPWSVVNYFSNGCEARTFWTSTGNNEMIRTVIREADEDIIRKLTALVNGETFMAYIDTSVIYPQIRSEPSSVYSFLLMAGYLKTLKSSVSVSGDFICELAIPNMEISLVYRKEILQQFDQMIPQITAIAVEEALFSGDEAKLKEMIGQLLIQSASTFDTAAENFYHGFMLGICALFGHFYVSSNREAGNGRYDICLEPKTRSLPGVIIELKAEKNADEGRLKELAAAAIRQIDEKSYDADMRRKGVRQIYKFGVAFSGKSVEVAEEG